MISPSYFIAGIFCFLPNLCHADTLTGKVVAVADGDTVTLLDVNNEQHKIRVAGIDAPERKQAFGERSKQNLARMVIGKTVQVEWSKLDRYGRVVGKVLTTQESCSAATCPVSLDVGLAQISSGLAWHYKKYEREQSPDERHNYAQRETEAQTKKTGIWSEPNPIAPWDFRRSK